MRQIQICASNISIKAEIFETISGNKIYSSLPIEGYATIFRSVKQGEKVKILKV